MLLVDDEAAGGAEFVDLGVGGLVFGRDAGVADQATVGQGGGTNDCGGSGLRILWLCTISHAMSKRSFARVF